MIQNPLKGAKVYLSGPIQYDTSNLNWRVEPTRVLQDRFGLKVFDPFADPKQQRTDDIKEAIETKNYDTITSIAKDFVRKDLSEVDESKLIVAFLPYKVPTVGTVHEIINSNLAKKPTLLVTDQPDIGYIPLWFWGFIKQEFMFAGWDKLYNYLQEVDEGKHTGNNRWRGVYKLI